MAVLALIEPLAGIDGHRFCFRVRALGAGDDGLQFDGVHHFSFQTADG
jgi:hypothetical protein